MRIVHISDLHFGAHQPKVVAAFFDDLISLNPELIIISGDLTQRGHSVQYQQFAEFLKCFTVPVLTVPGNHDIPLHNPITRFVYPFKHYKRYVSSELEAVFSNKEVNILGINSATPYKAKGGLLSHKALQQIKNHFLDKQKQLNILFFHHNLKYFSGMHQPLENAAEILAYLKDSCVHLVCTGHLHYANVLLIEKNDNKQCVLLHAGSTFSPRTKDKQNSFYFINTHGLQCTIDWRIYTDPCFSSYKIFELDFNNERVATNNLKD